MDPILRMDQWRGLDGYRIADADPPKGRSAAARLLTGRGRRFEPLSDRMEMFDPLQVPGVFLRYAAVATEEAALEFVKTFGYPLALSAGEDLEIAPMLRAAESMRQAVDLSRSGDQKAILHAFNLALVGHTYTELRIVDGVFRIGMVPRSLLQGMWIQFAQSLSANAALHSCAQCGALFATGAGTGRRSTGLFCSDACRKANHYNASKGKRS